MKEERKGKRGPRRRRTTQPDGIWNRFEFVLGKVKDAEELDDLGALLDVGVDTIGDVRQLVTFQADQLELRKGRQHVRLLKILLQVLQALAAEVDLECE